MIELYSSFLKPDLTTLFPHEFLLYITVSVRPKQVFFISAEPKFRLGPLPNIRPKFRPKKADINVFTIELSAILDFIT